MSENQLYVVATPIGNLLDISQRAHEVLETVDIIAAEDTRHTKRLLSHLGIQKPLMAVHDHNESVAAAGLVKKLSEGSNIALVSDAGTPLIADPGYHVLQAVTAAGFNVVPVPGACAIITALCASALPTDRFIFDGFLPPKSHGRRQYFQSIAKESRTVVVYESTHRIEQTLEELAEELGSDRSVVVARELTKTFETFLRGTAASILQILRDDSNQKKGEFVIMIRGVLQKTDEDDLPEDIGKLAAALAQELPVKQAAAVTAKVSGHKKNQIYQWILEHCK